MLAMSTWNPWAEMANLHRDLDAIVGRMFQGLDRTSVRPPYDAVRDGDVWKVSVPIPGVDPSQINLEVQGRTLRVRGEQSVTGGSGRDGESVSYAAFDRQITVPDEIDPDKVTARYRYGVLEIVLPLQESARSKRIAIDVTPEVKQLKAA